MSFNLKKTVCDLGSLTGKKVLVRVDFNVPISKEGVIRNDYRIRSSLPTIEQIIKQGGYAIIMSHLGRPTGVSFAKNETPVADKTCSLKPVATRLEELLNQPVMFAPDCMNAEPFIQKLSLENKLLVLENLRCYKEEGSSIKEERMVMAKKLASYGDFFVSDAFGTAHRNSASMTGIPKILGQGACGFLMEKEIRHFSEVLGNPPRPVAAIVGGAKVTDKIALLENLFEKIDKLFIGGAMAYTFLKAQGHNIGKSMCEAGKKFKDKDGKEQDIIELSNALLAKAKSKGVEVFLPTDHMCNTEFAKTETPVTTDGEDIPEDLMALDIGPKTIKKYKECISTCKTAIWNGPMGVFEIENFSTGTFAIASVMAEHTGKDRMLTIIGGGDSASAAELCGKATQMTHVSTGGGASLELLEGKDLPGISILDDA